MANTRTRKINQNVELNTTYDFVANDGTFSGVVTGNSFVGPLSGNVTGTVSSLSNHDTGDLDEGTNLYFTTARARAAFSAGTGVNITSGVISIGQSVSTASDVTFGSVTATTFEGALTGDVTGNADTASALEAAVNIALTGSVTGNVDFDGSGNVSITTTTNHNHDDRYYTETESDGKYLLNTTDILDGDLTITGDLNVTGTIDLSNADLNIGAADIVFGTVTGGATRGLIWDVSGSYLSKLIGGGADGGKVTLFANMDDAITTGNIFEIKDGSLGSLFLGLSHAGILTAGGGTSTQWNTAYTYSQVGHLPLAGGTLTGTLTTGRVTISNNVSAGGFTSFDDYQILLYQSSTGFTQSYGIGIESETMMFNSDNRYRFYVDNVVKATIESTGSLILTGGITASGYNNTNWDTAYTYSQVGHLPLAGGQVTGTLKVGNTAGSWGSTFIATDTGAGWGTGAYPYIGSNGGSVGSLIMLHNPHIPFRTDNAASASYTGRSGIRCAIDEAGNGWWDIGVAGDFFHLYKTGTGELFRVANNGNVTATGTITAPTFSGALSGNATTATTATTANNALALSGYALDGATSVATRIFNNKGQVHGTYTDFNTAMTPGPNYLQGGTNSPSGVANSQWYGFLLGLGSEYNTEPGNSSGYASQLYWSRQGTPSPTPYLWARDMEGGTWGSWRKMGAGYADTAGSALVADVASTANYATTSGSTNSVIWGNVSSTPTTLQGYGITGGYVTGSLGIGTTSPSAKLHVQGGSDDTSGQVIVRGEAANYTSGIDFYTSTSQRGFVGWRGPQSAAPYSAYGFYLVNYDNSPIIFGTSTGGEKMRIQDNGSVGIGTTSPAMKLSVAGGILAAGSGGNNLYGVYVSPTNENTFNSGYGSDDDTRDLWLNYRGYNDGFTRFRAVRIGNGKGVMFAMFDGPTGNTYLSTGGGKVGVGFTTPTAKFEVRYGGSNGSGGLSDYGIVTTCDSTNQATIGSVHDGDGYANLNLASNVGGLKMWHISKRLALDSHRLEYYYYDGGFTSRFAFMTNGDFHADGDVIAYSSTISDQRLKDDVKTIDNALDKVKAMRGVEYVWNEGSRKGQKDLGLIAQEVEQVLPEIVREKETIYHGEEGKYKTVDYEKIVGVLIEAIKEQQKQIDELKSLLDVRTK